MGVNVTTPHLFETPAVASAGSMGTAGTTTQPVSEVGRADGHTTPAVPVLDSNTTANYSERTDPSDVTSTLPRGGGSLFSTAQPRIVGLDLSLNRTGIATLAGSDSLTAPSGTVGFTRMRWIRARVLEWTNGADLVVVEAPAFSSNGKYAKEIAGLWHVVMISIDARGTRWIDVMSNSVKKYATGDGRADKSQMLAAAIKRLPIDVDNDDEADAAWLCAIGHELYGDPLTVMPAVNRTALDAIRVRTEQAS